MTDHQHTADVLNRAADHIQANGLYKGRATGPGDLRTAPACTVGAITYAGIMLGGGAIRACDVVQQHIGMQTIVRWSDAPNRTAAEVIEVLRATAVIEQARADEHTATDTGYDTAAAMRAVADDAAARTLAALR